jgi:tRNA-Thr(GGU) m(6)t(6)A37 methyltransferase TsaA
MMFEQALEGLCHFERIWVIFVFDQSIGWKPKVSPPKWAGKIGVFATRSPHRPAPVGMSCVRLKEISGRSLFVQGADLLDKTTILDLETLYTVLR